MTTTEIAKGTPDGFVRITYADGATRLMDDPQSWHRKPDYLRMARMAVRFWRARHGMRLVEEAAGAHRGALGADGIRRLAHRLACPAMAAAQGGDVDAMNRHTEGMRDGLTVEEVRDIIAGKIHAAMMAANDAPVVRALIAAE